jgi:two-component system OmpR family sensor kinase
VSRLERLPVRWRLALTSAGLTFAILLLFAVVIGVFTGRQVRNSFDDDLRLTAASLAARIHTVGPMTSLTYQLGGDEIVRNAAAGDASIRLISAGGEVLAPAHARDLGRPHRQIADHDGFRVASRPLYDPSGRIVAWLQYAKPASHVAHTMARIRLFLIFGVLAGTALALLAGLAIARRAMRPIARLTEVANTIAHTRDPAVHMPQPAADDEVADLARTLEAMLASLDASRAETEAALDRQRRFVADASHELRTPLTSILANLELLSSQLSGEDADAARSALRSSRRMRRLVADLLLLARADAGRVRRHEPIDLRRVVSEAAGEVAPLTEDHELSIDTGDEPLIVEGAGDELHRLALNLVQNSLVHTPPGTSVSVIARRSGHDAILEVSDNGPGIPPELRERVFDRFVRGEGDRSGTRGSGLGLSIVRAVAESHGGRVELHASESGGARFVARLPLAKTPPPPPPPAPQEEAEVRPRPRQAAPSGGA